MLETLTEAGIDASLVPVAVLEQVDRLETQNAKLRASLTELRACALALLEEVQADYAPEHWSPGMGNDGLRCVSKTLLRDLFDAID